MTRNINEMLAQARSRLHRLGPLQAADAVRDGALLVDIRPAAQRAEEGEIPDAMVIERNVLEWRLDPSSEARTPEAVDHNVAVVVVCSEGYTSSLAAASLQDLGLHQATDLAGGFRAWAAAGLPVQSQSVSDQCAPRGLCRSRMSDPLAQVVVCDPDPTSDLKDSRYPRCVFEWADNTLPTLALRWSCTREPDHPGQHLAGTGHSVVAVHPGTPNRPAEW